MSTYPARPLALTFVPETGLGRAALVVAGSLLLALSAQIAVPLPFSPVPVTGQTFAVLLIGAALGSRLGSAAVLLYLIEGAAGLPVFAPGTTLGVARLLGPTGGYLVGFVAGAAVVGALAERGWDRDLVRAAAAMLAGEVVIYLFGLIGLARFVPADQLLTAGLVPFIPGDIVKVALAALALPLAWRFVPGRR
jgi:biotin transport system substrate-specific component